MSYRIEGMFQCDDIFLKLWQKFTNGTTHRRVSIMRLKQSHLTGSSLLLCRLLQLNRAFRSEPAQTALSAAASHRGKYDDAPLKYETTSVAPHSYYVHPSVIPCAASRPDFFIYSVCVTLK